jgi:glycosyltransferase involved in cell wall biosynthesis
LASLTFSILLPTAVDDGLLQAALRSLAHAVGRRSDCEAIIVLDGLGQIRTPPRIGRRTRIQVSPGRGISNALNWGMQFAEGQYVVRMDADDLCHPTRFQDLQRLTKSSPDIIVGSIVKFGACRPRYEEPPQAAPQALEDLLHRGYSFAHPATTIRRATLEACGGYDSRFDGCEDLHLWLRMLRAGAVLRGSSVPHVYYRVHGRQFSRSVQVHARSRDCLTSVSLATQPCEEGCPGRLATYSGLQSGDLASVCRRYRMHVPVKALRRSFRATPVAASKAAIARGALVARQSLRARWELSNAK